MKNSVVIKGNDYTLYHFPLPKKNRHQLILGKKILKLYVAKQLEKFHPCFSPRDVFTLKRNKKNSDICVAVMDKTRLAEYSSKYKKNKFVVDDNLVFSTKHKVSRLLKILISCICLMFVLGFSIFFINSYSNFKDIDNTKIDSIGATDLSSTTKEISDKIISNTDQIENNIKKDADSVFSRLLENVNKVVKNNGDISEISFESKVDSFGNFITNMALSCKNFYPENIIDDEIREKVQMLPKESFKFTLPSIVYDNGRPSFSISSEFIVRGASVPFVSGAFPIAESFSPNSFFSMSRMLVQNHGGIMILEARLKNSFEATIKKSQLKSFSSQFIDLCLENKIGIESFSIKKFDKHTDDEKIKISITYGKKTDIAQFLCSSSSIFLVDKPRVNDTPKEITSVIPSNFISENLVKTGEIIRTDGTKIMFYKNKIGKISIIESEVKNEKQN